MSSSLKLSFKISCTEPALFIKPLSLLLRASMDCTISIFQIEQKTTIWFRKAEERTWLAEHRVETEWLSHGISHFLPGLFSTHSFGIYSCKQNISAAFRTVFATVDRWKRGKYFEKRPAICVRHSCSTNLYHLLFFVLVKYATFIFSQTMRKGI